MKNPTSHLRPSAHLYALLDALPVGQVKFTDFTAQDQRNLHTIAERLGIGIATGKTDTGQLFVIRLKTRPLHHCPKCGYTRPHLKVESCTLNVASSSIPQAPIQHSTLNAQRSTFNGEKL